MKRLLTTLCASLALCVPSMAHSEIEDYSYDAMICLKLGKCTEGVYKLETSDHTGEVKDILFNLDQMGVEVYEAIPEYFVDEYRALYYSDKNVIFLNRGYLDTDDMFIKTLRHEAWHAAQDCMAGTIENSLIAIIKPEDEVPMIWRIMAERTYPESAVPWEAEAGWAGRTEKMTMEALQSCARGTMWTDYEPTPMTREWLEENNYIAK